MVELAPNCPVTPGKTRVGLLALALVLGPGPACKRGDEGKTKARDQHSAAPKGGPLHGQGEVRIIQLSPDEDRSRALFTGWTRAHYEAVFARMLLGYARVRSPDGGRTRHAGEGGDELPAAMEGSVRMLPAMGAWLACACNPERIRVEGRELDVVDLATTMLLAGTDPESPDYWHKIRKGWDQRQVEAALVAQFLVRSKARVWERLGPAEREQVLAWLTPAKEPLAGNWLAFQLTRNTTLEVLGAEVPEGSLDELLVRLEEDYVGDGFYRDSAPGRVDWYNGIAIHPELTFWRTQLGEDDPEQAERAARVALRTEAFLGHLPFLMDSQGRVAPLGRSLAYRSGVLAALSASVVAGDDFVLPGLARRMLSGSLKFHLDAGMFDEQFALTRGYHGEQPGVTEAYLRPGSQYYLSRALEVLALPPEHRFWSEIEMPLPADLGDFVHAIPAVGWQVDFDRAVDRRAPSRPAGAGLSLRNAGSATRKLAYQPRYMKLDYGAFGWFSAADDADARWPYDGAVISASAMGFDRARGPATASTVVSGFSWQRHALPPEDEAAPQLDDPGASGAWDPEPAPLVDAKASPPHWISTATLSALPGSVDSEAVRPSLRLSCVEPNGVEAARPYEGSAAIRRVPEGLILGGGDKDWVYLETGADALPGAGAVLFANAHGWTRAGLNLDYGSADHVLGGKSAFAGLALGATHPGIDEPRCFASWQVLSERPFEPGPQLAALPQVSFEDRVATVRFANGDLAWVDLAPEVRERSVELAGLRATGPLRTVWVRADAQVVVAVGLRELGEVHPGPADENAPPLIQTATDTPLAFVACARAGAGWLCELDGPARLRSPGTTLMLSPSGWRGSEGIAEVTATVTPEEGQVLINPAEHGLGPKRRATTTVVAAVY